MNIFGSSRSWFTGDRRLSQAEPQSAEPGLTALRYDEQYYKEHAAAGIDYLTYGYWHTSYAAMISDATLQATYSDPFVIDAGCACGATLKGFKDSGLYGGVLGMDLSEHMIQLGRKHFGYSDQELMAGSITNMPIESGTVSLLHSAQVLEHIPDSLTDAILNEFARVLRPGGRAFLCLDAVREGETKEKYMGDPTHVNIQPVGYWTRKLQQRGLLFDVEAYNRFIRSRQGPTEGDPRSFYETYDGWNAWTVIKL